MLALLTTAVPIARADPFELPQPLPCQDLTPAWLSAASAPQIQLHLQVLLDGVTLEQGRATVAAAKRTYAPVGIDLTANFSTWTSQGPELDSILAQAKALYGGERPPWANAVMVLVRRDLANGGEEAAAGKVDCIGGMAFADRAFTVDEYDDLPPVQSGGVSLWQDVPAKVFAHELGHLLGAQHSYANCAQGQAEGAGPGDISPCTVMFNFVDLASLNFSLLEAAVVRGYAEAYVKPLTAPPPPDGAPAVALPPHGPNPCDATIFTDPAGDAVAPDASARSDDLDLLSGAMRTGRDTAGAPVTTFTWTVTKLDRGNPNTAAGWDLVFAVGNDSFVLEARYDGSTATGVLRKYDRSVIIPTTVKITPGTPGRIEAVVPLGRFKLTGNELKEFRASSVRNTPVLIYSGDDAAPKIEHLTPMPCASPSSSTAKRLALYVGRPTLASVRRAHALRVRIRGRARDVRIRLIDSHGRVIARAAVRRVSGTKTITLRVPATLPRGRYRVSVEARANGRRVRRAKTLTLR